MLTHTGYLKGENQLLGMLKSPQLSLANYLIQSGEVGF